MASKRVGPGFDGTDFVPDVNLEPGIEFDLWARDRSGFRVKQEMLEGGIVVDWGCYAGPEVGSQYSEVLGEGRVEVGYNTSPALNQIPDGPGQLGKEGVVTPGMGGGKKGSSMTGKPLLRAPQNYRLLEK